MVREYINMEDVVAMLSCRPTSDRKEAGAEFVARSNVFRRFSRLRLKKACKLSDKFGRRASPPSLNFTHGPTSSFSMTQTRHLGDFPPLALACTISHLPNRPSITILPYIYAPYP
jgi:hypothetical protein